jgi:NAD+ synthase (glutamine-hydrolysing)
MAQPFGVSVAQIRPRKGDYQGNLARVAEIFAEVDQAPPQSRPAVLVLPETALTGYFLEGGVREHARTAGTIARDLATAYAGAGGKRPLDVVLGFYESWRNTLFNSAMYVTLGDGEPNIRHVHRKMFLPTYGLFDEERFVERGRDIRAFDTPHGRAAVLICEDAWHSLTATVAALDGAQVLYVVSAAPARGMWPRDDGVPGPGSVGRWDRLIREIADEHGVFVVLANLVGSEGGKVFPGASFVAGPHGEIRGRAPLWDEAVLTTTIDAADASRARADTPLIADLEIMMPHLRASIDRIGSPAAPVEYDPPFGAAPGAAKSKKRAGSAPTPAVDGGRSEAPPLAIDAAMTADWLVHFIREEFRRREFAFGVVGVSGGVDSAVTAYLAARALGPDKVLGVRLPYRTSQPESLAHAQLVIDALGIESRTVDITGAVDGYLSHEPDADPGRRGNVMARVRMIALFDHAAKHRGVPIGTGNKTERLFGYFTWHADDSPPINPLGDLYKTQVLALARELGVPSVIVDKPPTADLVAGQTDEGDIGISYAKADAILNFLLSGFAPEEIVARGFASSEVELVHRRLASTHWKRRLPTVAVVSPSAIGESYLRPVDY